MPILHYDGTPITARFIVRAIAKAVREREQPATAKGGRMTYIVKPQLHHPTPDQEQRLATRGAITRAAFPRLRWLRARFHFRRHHPGLLGIGHRAASRGKTLRHRLQFQDSRLFSGCFARLQHCARPHAFGVDGCQSGQPANFFTLACPATAIQPPLASANLQMPCVVA